MIVLRAAGHVKNYQSYNNNYAPTLHAGMMTESKGHFSSEPLHSWNIIVSQLSHSAQSHKIWKLLHCYIKRFNVPTTDCDATFLTPIMLQICYFLQHKKYAGNMSKCPLSAEIFARRVGVVRTTHMTNSQVCFCHSLQYIMSPLTIDDWRKPSNKQSWSLPLLPPNISKEMFRFCFVWKNF